MSKSIGIYIDRESQEEHELFEEVGQVVGPCRLRLRFYLQIYIQLSQGLKLRS